MLHGAESRNGRCSSTLHLLTGTLQTTRPGRSIALRCTAVPDRGRPKHRKIALHRALNQDMTSLLSSQHKHFHFALKLQEVFNCLVLYTLKDFYCCANRNSQSVPKFERDERRSVLLIQGCFIFPMTFQTFPD